MKTCHEIRKDQLRALTEELGGVRALSEAIGKGEVQIRQWLNASRDSRTGKPRGIADDIARHIEEATGKPVGWMDNDPELAGVPGWLELSDIQRSQVIGFAQGLLAQSRPTHSRPYTESGDEAPRNKAKTAIQRKAS
ncbi:putative HTH-type transcriptional regulator [Pandoraea capi]|uniref:HTH-type transcriptional regulator n=1 Tax=Pandoraea capi TaxID=2508286 RepID=A0ABY6W0R7_9BURK|nr:hypothetical protein [Pandoraea capi]VVE12459.1 putative HTH-type transcriptional regulator [Pandoraea capi]